MSSAADRIAIISDVHGNLPAFEAVLADISARGISTIHCLGDLVGKGPIPAEVVDLSRQMCTTTVQGNWEAMVAGDGDKRTHHWNRAQLGIERLHYLRDLSGSTQFRMSGRNVRLFHASQISVFHRVHQYDTREAHLGMFENTDFTGDGPPPDIVGYGDIHIGYVKSFADKCLFNTGSVGNPLDITQACYAILEGSLDGEGPAPWAVNLVRVPYDIDEAVRQAEASDMPNIPAYVDELHTARYRGLPRVR